MERFAPGFWRAFFLAANTALAESRGAFPTSWYRDFVDNRRVRGEPTSQHLVGTALDVAGNVPELARAFRRQGFPVVIESAQHVHAQAFVSNPWAEFFLARS